MALWRPRRALTASVSVIPPEKRGTIKPKSKDAEWQKQAWALVHDLGELRYFAWYTGNALSRVRFFVGTRDKPGDTPRPIPDEPDEGDDKTQHAHDLALRDALERIKGRDGTFSSLVRVYGIQQAVAGESFLVGEDGLDGEKWEFLSTSEMRVKDAKNQVYLRKPSGEDGEEVEIGPNSIVLRFWTRDPEVRSRANSPVRAVLDIAEALRTAQAMQTAADRSRLASAGLLLIPSDADLPKAPVTDATGQQRDHLALLDELLAAMSSAMEDPGSPWSVVPILVEMQSDKIAAVQHVRFDRDVDRTLVARVEHLVRRLAQGLDMPPEKLLGIGSVNHWGAWQVSEEFITAHLAPMAQAFAEDLTVGFLHPTLQAIDKTIDLDRYAVGFSTEDLMAKPAPSEHALELWDRVLLSNVAALEALGFAEDDMPNDDEKAERLQAAQAQAPPPEAPGDQGPPDQQSPQDQQRGEQGPPPEQPAEPTDAPPTQDEKAASRLAGTCEMAIDAVLADIGVQIRAHADNSPLAEALRGQDDAELAAILGEEGLQTLALDPDDLLSDAWASVRVPLRHRLALQCGGTAVADRIISGLVMLAKARLFDPEIDVADAAMVLCRFGLAA